MLSRDCRRLVGIALVLSTTLITMPVSAADFTSANPVIGSVSAVGSVDLRGVGISQEGTLFAGDSIRSHEKGYAKVLLGTGGKIELYEQTQVTVNRDAQGVKIAMNTGNLGFTAKSTLRVDVAPFEVIASDDAAGNVAVMSPTTGGVRAIKGKVTVRNLKTSESFVLLTGQEQLLGLDKGSHTPPLGQIASNVPLVPPVPPAPAPQTPAGKTTNPGLAMDTGAWLAVLGAGALGAISIWALVEAHNNNNDINSLKNQITNLNNTITANQASNAAALKAASQAAALQANLAAQQAALQQLLANEQQALSALTASGQGSTSQAAALKSSITQTNSALSAVNSSFGSASACLANPASCNTAQLQTQTNTTLTGTNGAITNGNGSVGGAGQINSNVTGGQVGLVSAPPTASASVPL